MRFNFASINLKLNHSVAFSLFWQRTRIHQKVTLFKFINGSPENLVPLQKMQSL